MNRDRFSSMTHYIAIVHKDAESDFGISFPDFPGCISAGSTLQETLEMGREALEAHIAVLSEEGEAIPLPSSLDVILANPDNRDGTIVLVPAPRLNAKAVRINITIPADALKEIDAFAEAHGFTRSGFLTHSARRAMAEHPTA